MKFKFHSDNLIIEMRFFIGFSKLILAGIIISLVQANNDESIRLNFKKPSSNNFTITIMPCKIEFNLQIVQYNILLVSTTNYDNNCGSIRFISGISFPDVNVAFGNISLEDDRWYNFSLIVNNITQSTKSILLRARIPETVGKIFATSYYPENKIIVKWNKSDKPFQKILSYFISIRTFYNSNCTFGVYINCSNCNYSTSTMGDEGFARCTPVYLTQFGSFLVESISYRFIFNNQLIQPYTKYNILIQAGNKKGWNKGKTFILNTGPYISYMTTHFPSGRLDMKINKPPTEDGNIYLYMVVLKSLSGCYVWNLDCKECHRNKIINNSTYWNGCGFRRSYLQQTVTNEDILNVSMLNTKFIQPYTEYKVHLLINTIKGWRENWTIDFVSSQYYSSAPQLNKFETQFPNASLELNFTGPQKPNGQIYQYLIVIESDNIPGCISLFFDCQQCRGNKTLNETNRLVGCRNDETSIQKIISDIDYFYIAITNGSLILPFTSYRLTGQANNGYGWGDQLHMNFKSSQYISGPVANVKISSLFPHKRLIVSFKTPVHPSGLVSKYIIWVYSAKHKCLLRSIVLCSNRELCETSDTSRNIGSRNTGDCKKTLETTFNGDTNNMIEIVTNSKDIKSNSTYQIRIVPVNDYGWGEETTMDYYIAPEYVKATQYKCIDLTSQSLKCNWTITKSRHPGPYYFLFSCRNSSTEIFHEKLDYRITQIKVKKNIYPETEYTCELIIKSKHGFQFDNLTSETVKPEEYIPIKIANQEKTKIEFEALNTNKTVEDKNTDKSEQIILEIPKIEMNNEENNETTSISAVTIVVGTQREIKKEGELEKDNETGHRKCYEDCDRGRKCNYEILIDQSKQDKAKTFVIGADKTCKNKPGCLCNGLLAPDTEYKIGVRVYSLRGFLTVGTINKLTDVAKISWNVIATPLGAILSFIVISIVGVVVYKKYKIQVLKKKPYKNITSSDNSSSMMNSKECSTELSTFNSQAKLN